MNKPNRLIKICGIKDPEIAKAAVAAGANFIGIVFHPDSPRFLNLNQAIIISEATRLSGAIPVAIFCNHNDYEMRSICEATHIKTVQLHGRLAKAHHHLLPDDYVRIYVPTETEMNDQHLSRLNCERDFILIDHPMPGKGHTIHWKNFNYQYLAFRWFLAGGLSATNVTEALQTLQPNGVDVSSGVESTLGNKDIRLIKKFINAVRGVI